MNEAFNTAGFEQRVRDLAYALWESEGRPFGRDAEHWRLCEDVMRAELDKPTPAKPARPKKSARKRAAARH